MSIPVARVHGARRSLWRRLVAFLWRRKAVPLRIESPAEHALRIMLAAFPKRAIGDPDPPVSQLD